MFRMNLEILRNKLQKLIGSLIRWTFASIAYFMLGDKQWLMLFLFILLGIPQIFRITAEKMLGTHLARNLRVFFGPTTLIIQLRSRPVPIAYAIFILALLGLWFVPHKNSADYL